MRSIPALIFIMFAVAPASAETLTVVCKDPIGHEIGKRGALAEFKSVDSPDEMKGGGVTLTWDLSANEAKVITEGSGGFSLHTATGIRVFQTEEQISFVVRYPGAVWLYSVFPESKIMLMSGHSLSLGLEPASAINKSFQANCNLTVQ